MTKSSLEDYAKIFNAGYDACGTMRGNPYQMDTREWFAWEEGWECAHEDKWGDVIDDWNDESDE